ncbi:MAG: chain length determinant protein EpsF [Lautropia sp.]
MSFQQFFGILRGRWWLLAACFAIFVSTALAWSLVRPKMYTATARLIVDPKLADPVGGAVLPTEQIPAFVATQLDILKSEQVALKVVDRLNLLERPMPEPARDVEPDAPRRDPRSAMADSLLKRLKTRPSRDSNLIDVSFDDRDPEWATKIVNAFTRAYMETNVAMLVGPARDAVTFFEEQSAKARLELETAQKKLTDFQQSKGITSSDERFDVENARLGDIAKQLTEVEAQLIESRGRQSVSRGSADNMPEVLQNQLIQGMKSELSRLEARMSQQGASLGPNHPEMLRMREEAATLRTTIASETRRVVGSLGRANEINRQRAAELKAAYEAQRKKVLAVKGSRDEIDVLKRDVESAQRAYETIRQKLAQESLKSEVTQSSVRLVAAATRPILPSSPNLPLNTLVAAVLSTLLGLGMIFMLEFLNGKIRGIEDLERATRGEVLGTVRSIAPRLMHEIKQSAPALEYTPSVRTAQSEDEVHAQAMASAKATLATATAAAAAREEGVVSARLHGSDDDVPMSAGDDTDRYGNARGVRGGSMKTDLVALGQGKALAPLPANPLLPRTSRVGQEVVAAFDASHPMLDDIRVLRSQVKARWINRGQACRALAVLSQDPSTGKTFTAVNLAVTFAQIGARTLLVDADLRGGRIHQMFGIENNVGLSTLLSLETSPSDSITVVKGMESLAVLPSGPVSHNPSDLLERDNFPYVLDVFRNGFDVVILDTPPASEGPDAALIASIARGYVLVAREHQTLYRSVEKLTRKLEPMGAALIGSVLVKA